jgi:hypothetical protein
MVATLLMVSLISNSILALLHLSLRNLNLSLLKKQRKEMKNLRMEMLMRKLMGTRLMPMINPMRPMPTQ